MVVRLKLSSDDFLIIDNSEAKSFKSLPYLSLSAAGAVNLLKCSILCFYADCGELVSASSRLARTERVGHRWLSSTCCSCVKEGDLFFPQKWLVMRIMKLLLNVMLPLYLEPL